MNEIKCCKWECSEIFDAECSSSGECYGLGEDVCFTCECFFKCGYCKFNGNCSDQVKE